MAGYLEFWGVNVPPKKEARVDLRGQADTHFVHVTNLALGPNAAEGPHTVVLKTGGKAFTLVTLDVGGVTQYKTDTVISEAATFAHSGPGVVNITGYRAMLPGMPDMPECGVDDEALSDVEEGEEEEVESGSEEEEDDSDEAPNAVPIDSVRSRSLPSFWIRFPHHSESFLLGFSLILRRGIREGLSRIGLLGSSWRDGDFFYPPLLTPKMDSKWVGPWRGGVAISGR